MNLDFSQYPELDGPIVLLIGCSLDTPERLHLHDDAVIEANAQTVEIIDVRLGADDMWWIHPFKEDSMFQIFRRYTRKSYHTILKWMDSDKFVSDVRAFLAEMVENATSLEQLPENWLELVSLVVLGEQLEPRMSRYTCRVFEDWFPDAKFRESRFQGAVQPIWRDAEVAELRQQPSPAEVLEWPVVQLPGLGRGTAAAIRAGEVGTIGRLVSLPEQKLRTHALLSVDQIEDLRAAVECLGLKLGMTEEEIEEVRADYRHPSAQPAQIMRAS